MLEKFPNEDTEINYCKRGLAYYTIQNYDAAMEDYNMAISINPNSPVHYNRGTLYHALKEYTKAIEDYTKAISVNPLWAAAYQNRGVTYAALHDYTKAIKYYLLN